LFCLVVLPLPLRAADAKEGKSAGPTLVVRLQPIDTLLGDAKYLAAFADQEELVTQFQGLLKAKTGSKGLEGIDTKRPIGLYGTVGSQGYDSTGVVMVPVTDDKAFLDLLGRLNLKADEKEGLYTIKLENVPFDVYFRFANGYVYGTVRDAGAVAKDALLPPADVLPPEQMGTMSITLRLDRIGDKLKQLALGQVGLRLADLRDRKFAGDTEAQKEFWKTAFDDLGNRIRDVIRDGEELDLRLDVDRKAGDLAVELTLRAKPGTKLGTTIADLAKTRSLFAGALADGAALQALASLTLPEEMRTKLDAVIDDDLAKSLQKEADPGKREVATRFFKALEPTLKSGALDGTVVLRPTADGKHYALLLATRLKDGAGLDKAIRDLVPSLPAGDRDRFQLDVETVGKVKVHRIGVQKDFDAKAQQAFGDNPAYVAVRDDALFVALGPDGQAVLKEALAAQPGTAAPFQASVSLLGLAPAIAAERKDDKGTVARAAQDAFKDKGSDRIRVSVDGGHVLKVRFAMKAPVIKFVSDLDKAEKEK
jgi:hypothetical protein